MTKKLLALGLLLLLGACAPVYDRTVLPAASLTLHKDIFACEAKQEARPVKTFSEYTACQVAAERNFAAAVQMQRMDVFETYASRMLALAADRDRGLMTPKQVQSRAAAIRNDYWADCDCYLNPRRMARGHTGGAGNVFTGTDDGGGSFVNIGMGTYGAPNGH